MSRRLKRLLVRLLGRYAESTSALILTYHQISEPTGFDPFHLRVSPGHFAVQLDHLKARYRVVPLAELVRQVSESRIAAPGQVAITFDDGYGDNLRFALPALERAGLPATFFLTTAYLDSGNPFWWDELRAIVEQEEAWDLSDLDRLPGGARLGKTGDRLALYHQLHRVLQPLTDDGRRAELDQFRSRLRVAGRPQTDDRPLRWAEVKALVTAGHEVGSHTVTHPVLSALSPDQADAELIGSKQVIEAHMGYPVVSVAYPYGRPEAIGEVGVQAAKRAGYRCGVTTVQGTVRRGSDRFLLTRVHVGDWEQDRFTYELARCIAGEVWPLRRRHG